MVSRAEVLVFGETKQNTEETKKVGVDQLSHMIGFPSEFIQKELVLDESEMTVDQLRSSMLTYLEKYQDCLN